MEVLQIEAESRQSQAIGNPEPNHPKNCVFLVHGQNEAVCDKAARFLERLGLTLVILQEQADRGRTVIEKFLDHSSEVGFSVVLIRRMTGQVLGMANMKTNGFELDKTSGSSSGSLLEKLGRQHVCALCEEGVEIPSDYRGVLFVRLDKEGAWQLKLRERDKSRRNSG